MGTGQGWSCHCSQLPLLGVVLPQRPQERWPLGGGKSFSPGAPDCSVNRRGWESKHRAQRSTCLASRGEPRHLLDTMQVISFTLQELLINHASISCEKPRWHVHMKMCMPLNTGGSGTSGICELCDYDLLSGPPSVHL